MPRADILRTTSIERTPRVMQMEGIFDVAPAERSEQRWKVDFELPEKWNIGVIVGPSGSGKSTIARELFGEYLSENREWSPTQSLLDGFAPEMGIRDIVGLLSSVGFSSPPAWLRPFHVLSTGEQFRVSVARAIADAKEITVIDEFTSVVDRTVAKIGSAAIAKTIRLRQQKFIAVTCHYDVLEWLEPDWVYQPHTAEFALTERTLRRPQIVVEIRAVHRTAWRLFKQHHYLSAELADAAQCFVAFIDDRPAAFTSYMHFPHARDARYKREHRTVVLPDFQGIGLGNRLSEWLGEKLTSEGWRFISTTSHPAMIRHRYASPLWRVSRQLGLVKKLGATSSAITNLSLSTSRLTAGFEFVCRQSKRPNIENRNENSASQTQGAVVSGNSRGHEDMGISAHDGLLAGTPGGQKL